MFKMFEKPYEKEYKQLMATFMNHIVEHPNNLSTKGLQELHRYSICRALDLQTVASNKKIEELSFGLVQALKLDVNELKLLDKPISYRQGILEACVHALDKTMRRVNNGRDTK